MGYGNRVASFVLKVVGITFLCSGVFAGQPGYLDTTFAPSTPIPGTIRSEFPESMGGVGLAVVAQADGRIIAAGEPLFHDTIADFGLVRYNVDGTYDTSFGTGGFVRTNLGGQDELTSVALCPGGRIVAAGASWPPASYATRFAVVSYNTDGSLDTTFGDEGILLFSWMDGGGAESVVVQDDGKILLVGSCFIFSERSHMVAARLEEDGSFDSTFGVDGKVVIDFGVSDRGNVVALQPDGKIIVAGIAWNDTLSGWVFAVARLMPDGTFDAAFGTGGKVTYAIEYARPEGRPSQLALDCRDVAIQPDGKIILAGYAGGEHGKDFVLVRLAPDGSLDSGFGSDGIVFTDFTGDDDKCYAVELLNDGTIVAVGSTYDKGFDRFYSMAYYQPDGQLDARFGENGLMKTMLWAGARAATVSGDRLVVAGRGGYRPFLRDLCVACYDLQGSRDGGPAPGAELTASQNKTSLTNATSVTWLFGSEYPETAPQDVIAQLDQPSYGTVENNMDGSLTYYPERKYRGYDMFTYTDFTGRVGVVTVFVRPVSINDFSGDGKTDLIAYSGASGAWQAPAQSDAALYLNPNTVVVSGDYTGDGQADFAFYGPDSGRWDIFGASGNIVVLNRMLGGAAYQPVAGDYTGDGTWDMVVYDQSLGLWYGCTPAGKVLFWAAPWGGGDLVPVAGDYDGDGRFDMCLYSPSRGSWYIQKTDGTVLAWDLPWGGPGMMPVSGDFNGDGVYDLCLYAEASGEWYVLSLDEELIVWAEQWGAPGLAPVSGDFNGDGSTDFAVYARDTGRWFIRTRAREVIFWNAPWGSVY